MRRFTRKEININPPAFLLGECGNTAGWEFDHVMGNTLKKKRHDWFSVFREKTHLLIGRLLAIPFEIFALIAYLLFSPNVGAAEGILEHRVVTENEIKSFNHFYKKLHPTDKFVAPTFSATRIGKNQRWSITATIFNTSGRGFKNLCHGQEDNYVVGKSGGAKEEVWREGYQKISHVWIDRGSDCTKPAQRVELSSALPDVEVLDLLENANVIRNHYGAFIKGFTCRRISSAVLSLVAIGTGTDNKGEIMYKLRYRNEAGDSGELLVRKIGREFTPWDFRCSAS